MGEFICESVSDLGWLLLGLVVVFVPFCISLRLPDVPFYGAGQPLEDKEELPEARVVKRK